MAKILIVEDNRANMKLTSLLLRKANHAVLSAVDAETGLMLARSDRPDLILMDIQLPGMDGLAATALLKRDPVTASIPVIALTAMAMKADQERSETAGCDAFIAKPLRYQELYAAIDSLLAERQPAKATILIVDDEPQHRKLLEALLRAEGYLTVSVPSGEEAMAEVARRPPDLILLDVMLPGMDGHQVAKLLKDQPATANIPVVMVTVHDDDNTRLVGLDAGAEEVLTKPIGRAELGLRVRNLLRLKASGGSRHHAAYTGEMSTEMSARLELETALRRAVADDEFVLHYQPKVHLDSGRIAGVEALLRWERPGHGLVSPADFIPVLEETGLIVTVGRWVIATACEQIGRWTRSPIGPLQVSVNVSGRQFIDGDLETDVIRALEEHRVPAGLLELELTETSLMTNAEGISATLERLKALGVQISIDDFGTGYSSLARLRRFPIDKLKIDIAFIRDITTNPDDAAIARTIISMAHSLKLDVIAEGVETAAQLAYLRRHHCDQIQGHYFSRPLPLAELEVVLGEAIHLPAPPGEDSVPLKTLLVVDDDPDALGLLQALLRQDGYHILSALSGAEGLELLALHDVQVVLCDQRMPAMSGSEFLDRVKDLHPDTVRIMVSAYADLESIMEAINRGAIYRFYKAPWEGEVMRENLRDAFRHYDLLHDASPVLAGEAELERRNGQLVRFAATAAHDLRQPLQVIGGYAALLAHRFADQLDDEARECVAAIGRGTRTMDVMVEGILEFAGDGQAPSPGALVDTARVVGDVVNDLQPALDGGSIVVRGSLPVLPGDPAQLARLFQNLIGNAVKFRGEDPPRVEVAAERAGAAWMFRVTDNGIGIGAGFADRLFEILQRERRGNQPGTGMGLAICRKIVEYHGGRIWLDPDAAGAGATFRFTLPAGGA